MQDNESRVRECLESIANCWTRAKEGGCLERRKWLAALHKWSDEAIRANDSCIAELMPYKQSRKELE